MTKKCYYRLLVIFSFIEVVGGLFFKWLAMSSNDCLFSRMESSFMEILAAFYKFAIINKNLSERFSSECQKESAFALVLL